jgi:hypothetical protein
MRAQNASPSFQQVEKLVTFTFCKSFKIVASAPSDSSIFCTHVIVIDLLLHPRQDGLLCRRRRPHDWPRDGSCLAASTTRLQLLLLLLILLEAAHGHGGLAGESAATVKFGTEMTVRINLAALFTVMAHGLLFYCSTKPCSPNSIAATSALSLPDRSVYLGKRPRAESLKQLQNGHKNRSRVNSGTAKNNF